MQNYAHTESKILYRAVAESRILNYNLGYKDFSAAVFLFYFAF